MSPARQERQAIFLGTTGPRAARPGKTPPRSDASRPRRAGRVNELVKYADIDARCRRANNLNMTIVERLHAARVCSWVVELTERAGLCRHSIRHVNHALFCCGALGRDWHEADVRTCLLFVRFEG